MCTKVDGCVHPAYQRGDSLAFNPREQEPGRCRANMAQGRQSRPWLSGNSPSTLSSCPLFSRKQTHPSAVPRRARVKAHRLFVSLNSRLEMNTEEEEEEETHPPAPLSWVRLRLPRASNPPHSKSRLLRAISPKTGVLAPRTLTVSRELDVPKCAHRSV